MEMKDHEMPSFCAEKISVLKAGISMREKLYLILFPKFALRNKVIRFWCSLYRGNSLEFYYDGVQFSIRAYDSYRDTCHYFPDGGEAGYFEERHALTAFWIHVFESKNRGKGCHSILEHVARAKLTKRQRAYY